LSSYFLWRK